MQLQNNQHHNLGQKQSNNKRRRLFDPNSDLGWPTIIPTTHLLDPQSMNDTIQEFQEKQEDEYTQGGVHQYIEKVPYAGIT